MKPFLLPSSVFATALFATVVAGVAVDNNEGPFSAYLSARNNGGGGNNGNGTGSGGYVTVEGTRLYEDGNPYYITGMNYWSCMNLAADASAGGNQSRFETEIQQLADRKVNMLRIMASSEGAPTIQPNRMYPALMESPYHWNEDIFVGLDRCLDKMDKLGMKAIMTLANTWNWSGGFGQYVSWFNGNESIPYPPSWDPLLNPPYGDYTTNGTWQLYTLYSLQFYTTPQVQDLYRSHISKVLNRRNTVNGRLYKDDPAVLAWELANEPQVPLPYDWIDGTAKYIKDLGAKQLVTSGFEGKQGEFWWKLVHKSENIDFACAHWWVQNQGIYDPTNSSQANLQVAIDSFTQYIYNVSSWARDLGKPALIEEFGMARNEWENVARGAPNSSYLYNDTAGISNKDEYFRHIVTTSLQYFLNDSAIAGTSPWAYGGLWRPFNQRNDFNEAWAGDPPHEAPGWYDIYDKDNSTLSIIEEQAINATKAIQEGRLSWN